MTDHVNINTTKPVGPRWRRRDRMDNAYVAEPGYRPDVTRSDLRWLRITAVVGIALTAADAVVVGLIVAGPLPVIVLAGSAVLMLGPMALALWSVAGWRLRRADRLLATGVAARAEVAQVCGTNSTINNKPVLRFVLRPHVDGRPGLRVTIRAALPPDIRFLVRPGMSVPVRFAAGHPKRLVIDWAEVVRETTPSPRADPARDRRGFPGESMGA